MADIDLLPARGIPFRARVDALGVAFGGTSTLLQLKTRGMRPVCVVDSTGVNGTTTVAQLASAGIQAVCLVDQNGVSGAPVSTIDQLKSRGIRPMVQVTILGVSGTSSMLQLAARGLEFACLVDETGTVT